MKHSQDLNEDVADVLLSEDQIRAKVTELGSGSAPTMPAAS